MKNVNITLILCNIPAYNLKIKISYGKAMYFSQIYEIFANIFVLINTLDPYQG